MLIIGKRNMDLVILNNNYRNTNTDNYNRTVLYYMPDLDNNLYKLES